MRRTARTITAIVFLCIVVAGGLGILYLGTSTGLTFGGGTTITGAANAKSPYYAQLGWLQNTSPWPVTITKIQANASQVARGTTSYIVPRSGGAAADSKSLKWVKAAEPLPFQLDGGSLRYLGFALAPAKGQVGWFGSFTVSFRGPLWMSFTKTFTGADLAVASSTLPDGLLATDPTSDNTSLNGYVQSLRTALSAANPAALAVVMGGDATAADATALLKAQTGYVTAYKLNPTAIAANQRHVRLVFYKTDVTKDALPPIVVTWSQYRWAVTPH
jgi:hypothetical protein